MVYHCDLNDTTLSKAQLQLHALKQGMQCFDMQHMSMVDQRLRVVTVVCVVQSLCIL